MKLTYLQRMTSPVRRLEVTVSMQREVVLEVAFLKECVEVQMTGNAAFLHLKVGLYQNGGLIACCFCALYKIYVFLIEMMPSAIRWSEKGCKFCFQTIILKCFCAPPYTPNGRFLVQETFPKTLPRFVLILISLQRLQHRACKETKHFVSPHLIGPQLHQHDLASK